MKFKNIVVSLIIAFLISILSAYTIYSPVANNETILNTKYPSKVEYIYGWSDDVHLLTQKDVIEVLPDGLILEGPFTFNSDNELIKLPDTDIILHKKFNPYAYYYYLNKVAFIQIDGHWIPYAFIGSRQMLLFRVEIFDDFNQMITYGANKLLDIFEAKPHFHDDNWIINKAIESYENDEGIYSDIYGTAFRFSYEIPKI